MLPVPSDNSLTLAYIFAILTLVLQTVNTVTQSCTKQKRSNYLPARIVLLVAIFFTDGSLISFIVVDRSNDGARWVLAIWVLVQLSILLGLYLETLLYLRICNNLSQDISTRMQGYSLTIVILCIILIFTIVANAFAQSHNQIAIVIQILGCFLSHMFALLFPLWILSRGEQLLPVLRSKSGWGLLSCLSCSLLAAIASLSLLGLPGLYPKYLGELVIMFVSLVPWTILQFYKLTKVVISPESTEDVGIGLGCMEGITQPPITHHELQNSSDKLITKIEELL